MTVMGRKEEGAGIHWERSWGHLLREWKYFVSWVEFNSIYMVICICQYIELYAYDICNLLYVNSTLYKKNTEILFLNCLAKIQRFYNILCWGGCGKIRNKKYCNPLELYKYIYSFTITSWNLIPKIFWQEYKKIFTQGLSFILVLFVMARTESNPNIHQ